MNIHLALLVSTIIINSILVCIILFSRKNAYKQNVISTFTVSVVGLMMWSTSNYFADTSSDLGDALFWTRATFPPSMLMIWMIWWFASYFPDDRNRPPLVTSVFCAVIAIGVMFISMTSLVIKTVDVIPGEGIGDVQFGPLYIFVVAIYLVFILHTLYILISKYRHYSHSKKSQLRYVLLGWSVFLFGATMTNLILPLLTQTAQWSKFGPLFSVAMVAMTTYAIIRHQLMDIRIIIQRGAIYVVLASIVTTTYLCLVFILGVYFQKSTQITIFYGALMTTFFGVFTVPFLTDFLKKLTNPWFFKGDYDYFDVSSEITHIVQTNTLMPQIIQKTISALDDTLNLEKVLITSNQQSHVYFVDSHVDMDEIFSHHERAEIPTLMKSVTTPEYLDQPHINNWMLKNDYTYHTPIIFNDEVIGNIFLGEKMSGDRFFVKDQHLIKQTSHQLSAAMEKAYLFGAAKKQSELLEKQVIERTSEIKKLQESQEKMMVDISHTLKTPLTVLRTELDVLTKSLPQEETLSLEHSIDDVSRSLSSLMKLSRMENMPNKGNSSNALIDLSAITELICDYFSEIATKKNITLEKDIVEKCFITGNPEEVEDLIVNLIENAIKYMPQDIQDKKIFCIIERTDDHVALLVEDTGNGISSDHLPHIFDRFYRAKDESSRNVTGSGLGLAICREIVKKHGGSINAENLSAGGASFSVHFPSPSPYVVNSWKQNKQSQTS